MTETAMHSVRDGTKTLTFDGELLAHLSTRRASVPRWTEMSLYRTVGGNYVYEKIGRSRVVHMPGCSKIVSAIPRFQENHPGEDPDNGFEYCGCVPDEYDFTRLLSEEDRYTVVVSDSPTNIVDALYKRKAGTRELPQLVSSLIDQAASADSAFRDGLRVEEHID